MRILPRHWAHAEVLPEAQSARRAAQEGEGGKDAHGEGAQLGRLGAENQGHEHVRGPGWIRDARAAQGGVPGAPGQAQEIPQGDAHGRLGGLREHEHCRARAGPRGQKAGEIRRREHRQGGARAVCRRGSRRADHRCPGGGADVAR